MNEKNNGRKDIEKTVNILMQLDKESLLLIDSGAKLLMARQEMDKESRKTLQEA